MRPPGLYPALSSFELAWLIKDLDEQSELIADLMKFIDAGQNRTFVRRAAEKGRLGLLKKASRQLSSKILVAKRALRAPEFKKNADLLVTLIPNTPSEEITARFLAARMHYLGHHIDPDSVKTCMFRLTREGLVKCSPHHRPMTWHLTDKGSSYRRKLGPRRPADPDHEARH